MTQIKKVKTSEGVQFYPQTHTKAVIDDNGYTAESRLQAMQDEINQAQLEVGAVPSDLAPTKGSTNWVTSGGIYNSMVQSLLVLGDEEDMIFPREDYTDYEYLFYSNEHADYIELPFDPYWITRIEGSFSRTGNPLAYERIFGNWVAEGAICIRIINNDTSDTSLGYNFKTQAIYMVSLDLSENELHTFSIDYNTYTLDNSSLDSNKRSGNANSSHICVFPGFAGGCNYKMYTLYVTYNGNLHTLTPVRSPLGVYGFYDEYDNKFYASNNHYITGGN